LEASLLLGKEDPDGYPNPCDENKCQDPVQNKNRTGKPLEAVNKKDGHDDYRRGEYCCLQNIEKIDKAGITPHSPVKTKADEGY
jgi:hypothetical protein